jgi:predicted phosphodiesterase
VIAIIADIHANRAALVAVLAEARRRGAERLVVLGDIVGYHAEPAACIELLAAWPLDGVIGNHDLGAIGAGDRFASRTAAALQAWTASQLGPAEHAFLAALPRRSDLGWCVAVHGCFTHPESAIGYVTPSTAERNLDALGSDRPRLGLFGHSHVPALHVRGEPDRFGLPAGTVELPRRRSAIVNPGSVGQPRDGDPRASFALIDPADPRTIEIVRIPYDLAATVRAVEAAGLPAEISARLQEAR